jgi:O-antigen ligase/Flp pilus assembly protein TadD
VINRTLLRHAVVPIDRFVLGVSSSLVGQAKPLLVGVLSLITLLVFSPLLEGGTTHLAVMINRLLILFLFVVSLWIQTQTGLARGFRADIGLTILAYLGLVLMSALYSPYPHQSLQWLIVLFSYALLLYVLVSLSLAWDDVVKLMTVLIGMGVLEACLAIVQGAWLKALRPSGTFFNPNFLAGYLVTAWSVLLGYLSYGIRKNSWKKWQKALLSLVGFAALILMMALFIVAILWTGSRGAMLALFAATALIVVVRYGLRGISICVLLIALVLLTPSPFRERLQAEHEQNRVSYARWQIWQSAVHEMIHHPFGIGVGLSQYVYPRYALPIEGQITRYGKVAQTAHNEYLQMGVELGVAGLAIFCLGVILVARDAMWILRQRLWRWQRGLIVGVSGAITAVLIHAAVDSNLHEPALAIVLIFSVGIVLSTRRLVEGAVKPGLRIPVNLRRIVLMIGVGLVGIAGIIVVRLGVAWGAYEAGSRALESQNFPAAIRSYQTAVALDSAKALYHSSLGAAHFQVFQRTHKLQSGQTAVDELQLAIQLNPLDGHLFGLLGHVYMNFSSSMSRPDSTENAISEQRLSWLRAASKAYQRAIELEPFTPFYLLELGKICQELGERETAEAYVKRGIELEPNYLPGREWLATLYLKTGRLAQANDEYREILERQRRYDSWSKDAVESRFLTADVSSLTVALERERREQ